MAIYEQSGGLQNKRDISALISNYNGENNVQNAAFEDSAKIGMKVYCLGEDMTVIEAKKDGNIPEKYQRFFPDTCECGAPIITSPNFGNLSCSNYRCHKKIAKQIVEVCRGLGVKGIGAETAYDMVLQRGYHSVIDFILKPDPKVYEVTEIVSKKSYDFIEAVQLLKFYSFNAKASNVFEDINSYADYEKEIAKAGSLDRFVIERIGGTGREAGRVSAVLEAFDYELRMIDKIFNIRQQAELEFPISITKSVVEFSKFMKCGAVSKKEYCDYLNRIYPKNVKFILTNTAERALFIISDQPEYMTEKRKIGERKGNLLTSVQFLRLVCNTEPFFKMIYKDEEVAERKLKLFMKEKEEKEKTKTTE